MDEMVLQNFYNQEPIKHITYGTPVVRLTLEDIPNVLFTSDMHLQHKNIIEFTNRPFDSVETMNISLVQNWVDEVEKIGVDKAIVFHCGDFVFGTKRAYNFYINRLPAAKIYMVIGNHDHKNVINQYEFLPDTTGKERVVWNTEYFVEIVDNKKKKICGFTVTHHPYMSFSGKFNIHGHLHTPPSLENYTGADKKIATKLLELGTYYDVGVDGNNYRPVKLLDVLLGNTLSPKMSCVDYAAWNEILTASNIIKN